MCKTPECFIAPGVFLLWDLFLRTKICILREYMTKVLQNAQKCTTLEVFNTFEYAQTTRFAAR